MNKTIQHKITAARCFLLGVLFAFLFTLLSTRVYFLQCKGIDDQSRNLRKDNYAKNILPAKRGNILDRNGEVLALSVPTRVVVADLNHLRNLTLAKIALSKAEGLLLSDLDERYGTRGILDRYWALVAKKIEPFVNKSAAELVDIFENSKRVELVVERSIGELEAKKLEEILTENLVRGIELRKKYNRVYPLDQLASHVLGFVDFQNDGKNGIEASLNKQLQGEDGWIYKSTRGLIHSLYLDRQPKKEIAGADAVLSIDVQLQQIVETALDNVVKKYHPQKASAVFIDPNTGDILAMANRPTFDPNNRVGSRRNYAVEMDFDPGSTFKIVSAGASLDTNTVTLNTKIFCENGKYTKYSSGRKLFDLTDYRSFGTLTVEDIVARSSNIGIYKLNKLLGEETFYDYIRKFGFGEDTGIDIFREQKGIVRPPSQWSPSCMSRIGMGYGITVTPLQIAMAYSAIANGGELMRPRLVKEIRYSDSTEPQVIDVQVRRRVLSSRAANDFKKALIKAVQSDKGTGPLARVEGYTVAGKTGTAQKKCDDKAGYYKQRYVTSFVGFIPAENPKIVGVIVIDDPKNEVQLRRGGRVAGPVFSEIAGQAMTAMNVRPWWLGQPNIATAHTSLHQKNR